MSEILGHRAMTAAGRATAAVEAKVGGCEPVDQCAVLAELGFPTTRAIDAA